MASLTDLPNDLKQMGLENPKEMAEAFRPDRELTDEQKDRAHSVLSNQSRNFQKVGRQQSHAHRNTKTFTSRGIKRMMARVDKPEHPRRRNRRPRNGFAD